MAQQTKNMLYYIVRPIATLALRIFYRKIHLSNSHHLLKGKPVILAANHPTGFMEPCILACYLDRPLYYLVRGDLFRKPFYRRLLESLHMVPVYRVRDGGFAAVKNNYETFDYCFNALRDHKTLMILAEGTAEHEKRLRPLKKGPARVAFGALERYPNLEDIYIVPTGVNYTYAEFPRTEVMIDLGEPIRVRDYFEKYKENPNQASAELTETLRQSMAERIVIIERPSDEDLTEYLLQLNRSQRPEKIFPIVDANNQPLHAEKSLADQVNAMPEATRSALLAQAKAYFEQLKVNGITDAALLRPLRSALPGVLLLILGLPFFLLGYVANILPIHLAQSITKKRVRRPEFRAPVLWAISMGAYLIYWILWLLVLLIFTQPIGLLWLLLMPTLGYLAILYREYASAYNVRRRAARLPSTTRQHLLQQRADLQAQADAQLQLSS